MMALVELRPDRPLTFFTRPITLFANLTIFVSVFVAVLVVLLHSGAVGVNGKVEAVKGSCNCTILSPWLIENVERLLMYARRANGDITPLIYTVIGALLVNAIFLDLKNFLEELMPFYAYIIYYIALVALGLDQFSFLPDNSLFVWIIIFGTIDLGIRLILWLFVKILGLNQDLRRFRMFVVGV